MGLQQRPTPNQHPTTTNIRTLKMKSFVTIVFLNIALARPDHGGLHHGAHHAVHHQSLPVHHAVHHQSLPVHHAVHHNHMAPVVAKVAPKTIAELVVSEPRFSTLLASWKLSTERAPSPCSPPPTRLSRKSPRKPW